MSYQVLSRKFRPQKFEEVIGQNHVSRTLQNAIKLNRVAHGYIFSGPRGVGKTTMARILAKALNCKNPEDNNPCGSCTNCLEITDGRNMDVLEIDGASNRGIDDIRELRESAKYPPTSGKFRVYIIDEVHMLTKEAFNALLKTLEEPAPYVIFILATTDQHKIPATIISRTQRFDFKRISVANIIKQMKMILENEKISYDDDSLILIALKADGGLRDALSVLDQVIAFNESQIEIDTVRSVLGVVESSVFLNLLKEVLAGNKLCVLNIIDKTLSDGTAITDLVSGFNDYVRNCLVVTAGEQNLYHLDDHSLEWLKTNKSDLDIHDLLRIMEMSLKFETTLRHLKQPRIGLESHFLKLTAMDSSVSISDLLSGKIPIKVDEDPKEKKKTNQIDQTPELVENSSNSHVKKINETIVNAVPEVEKLTQSADLKFDGEVSSEIIWKNWDKIVGSIQKVNAKTSHFLEICTIAGYQNKILNIEVPGKKDGFKIKNLNNDISEIENMFRTMFGQSMRIKFKATNSGSEQKTVKKVDSIKDIKNHPLSMEVLEKFEGEILR